MAFTKVVGAGIHTLSNIASHNINSSGIITATKFVGPFDGSNGDFSGNVTIDGNLTVNGTTTTLDTNLTEVDKVEVAANNSTVGVAITQSGSGDLVKLYDGTASVVTVKGDGKIGIATALPLYRVDIGDGITDPASGYQFRINAAGDYIFALAKQSNASFSIRNNSTSVVHLNTQNSKRLALGVSTGSNSGSIEEHVNINSGGSLIVGSTTYGAAGSFSIGANGTFRQVLASGTAQDTLIGGISGVSNGFQVNTDASNNQIYSFHNGSTVSLRILSDGKVGIGITNPAEKFEVKSGNIAIVGGLGYKIDTHPLLTTASFTDISGGSYAARLGSTGTSTIRSTQIYGGGNHIATFDGVNYRLGIYETTPEASLHITGGLPHIRLENSGTSASAGDILGQIDFKHNDSDDAGVTAAIKCIAEDNVGNSYLTFNNGDGGNADERLRIDSIGRLLVNTTDPINTSTFKFQVASNDANGSAILARFNASIYSSYLDFYKSRSNTLGTAYSVNHNDHLGAIRYYAADGSNSGYTTAAEIYGSCDGGSGAAGDMPGRITFHTRPDGAGEAMKERVRITAAGHIVTQGLTGTSFNNDGDNTKVFEVTGDGTVGEYGVINISGNQNADDGILGIIKFINRENSASSSGSGAGSRQIGSIEMRADTSDTNAGDDCGGYFRFITKTDGGGNAQSLRISSNGDVGFGNHEPDVDLHIKKATTTTYIKNETTHTSSTYTGINLRTPTLNFQIWNQGPGATGYAGANSVNFWQAAATGPYAFFHGNSERLRITTGGQVRIGNHNNLALWGQNNRLQVAGTDWSSSGITIACMGNSGSSNLVMGNSRATTPGGSGSALISGDRLGYISFVGDDGTDMYTVGAAIVAETDANSSSNSVPGDLQFYTGGNGSGDERLRITSDGLIQTKTRSASVRRMILSGSPSNSAFNIEAHDGATGTGNNTNQGELGLYYNDGTTLTDEATIKFYRGSGANDGHMVLTARNYEMLSIGLDHKDLVRTHRGFMIGKNRSDYSSDHGENKPTTPYYAGEGEKVFGIDPSWSNEELQKYFRSDNVQWYSDETAPGGYCIQIDGSVNVGGAYRSGFPYIPIDDDDQFFQEMWIRAHDGSQGHYAGSIQYDKDFGTPTGWPGSYGYELMSNTTINSTTWTRRTATLGPNHSSSQATGSFRSDSSGYPGKRKYWTPQALFNYTQNSGTRRCYISGWSVYRRRSRGNTHFASISADSNKGFRIPHPLTSKRDKYDLFHNALEGPKMDLIYRGKVNLVGGSSTVNLDTANEMTEGTFVLLNHNVQCFTSNESGWTPVKGSVSGNILTITAQDNTSTDTIAWMVVGERHDDCAKGSEFTDDTGKLIVELRKDQQYIGVSTDVMIAPPFEP